jgi:hypothetical protein
MKIDSLKDLKKLIDLCQKNGVEAIEVDGVKMNLRPVAKAPITRRRRRTETAVEQTTDGTLDVADVIDMPDELTDEQLLFFSVTNPPEGAAGEQ